MRKRFDFVFKRIFNFDFIRKNHIFGQFWKNMEKWEKISKNQWKLLFYFFFIFYRKLRKFLGWCANFQSSKSFFGRIWQKFQVETPNVSCYSPFFGYKRWLSMVAATACSVETYSLDSRLQHIFSDSILIDWIYIFDIDWRKIT